LGDGERGYALIITSFHRCSGGGCGGLAVSVHDVFSLVPWVSISEKVEQAWRGAVACPFPLTGLIIMRWVAVVLQPTPKANATLVPTRQTGTPIYNIYKVDPHYVHLMFASFFHNEPHHLYYLYPSDHHQTVVRYCKLLQSYACRLFTSRPTLVHVGRSN
jgi:hypothetical protein